jgi:acetyl-CoA acetyltransferase
MAMSDFDVFEINEAFASVVLSWAQVAQGDLMRERERRRSRSAIQWVPPECG